MLDSCHTLPVVGCRNLGKTVHGVHSACDFTVMLMVKNVDPQVQYLQKMGHDIMHTLFWS